MFKHIVMWNLNEPSEGSTKEDLARQLKEKLEALKDSVPQVVDIELGISVNDSEVACDVVLYSTFRNREDFEAYRKHPEHQMVVSFLKKIVSDRHVVDYEA